MADRDIYRPPVPCCERCNAWGAWTLLIYPDPGLMTEEAHACRRHLSAVVERITRCQRATGFDQLVAVEPTEVFE